MLGQFLPEARNNRAMKHLNAAADVFRRLGVTQLLDKACSEISKRRRIAETVPVENEQKNSQSVVSQLLMVRLAEATASRELLFRELVAVLQQESQAKKILIAVKNDKKQVVPFITHGYTADESTSLIRKFQQSADGGDEKAFARSKNVAVFP
jgi:hypothetical protein